jgi:transglycosylase-like protein
MTRRLLIALCACAVLVAPAAAHAAAPHRYQAAYKQWRHRLQSHDVFVGRNLLAQPTAQAVAAGDNGPTKDELRHSIHRMQKRWGHWLRTSRRGREVAFKLKVRDQIPSWGKAHLRGIAWCESKNDPHAIGGGGAYRGMYQFSFSTWAVVGGQGDPVAASRWEQTWRAWLLLSRHGAGHWPICG